jgi:predicted nucleotide-binding protein
MAEDSEDWVSAWEAVQLLKPVMGSEWSAQRTICERAHDGLIQSRAARFVEGKNKERDHVELLRPFWRHRGGNALKQNWRTGDFEMWSDRDTHCRAYGVEFLRADIEKIIPPASSAALQSDKKASKPRGTKIFIAHGHSDVWRALKDFIVDDLHLTYDEFQAVPTAGKTTIQRLQEMLDDAAFAFLVLTGEDKRADIKAMQARLNVVHEAGLFQAQLGFDKAIILLEEGCDEFSNIHGLTYIPFPRGSIKAAFHEVRRVLVQAGIIQKR